MVLSFELLPDYDCATCTASMKKQRGCDAKPALPIEMDGEVLQRCPRRPLLDDPQLYADLFWLYQSFKEGHLPESTSLGLYGQPAVFLRAVRVIDAALADIRTERETKQKKIAAAKARAAANKRGS